MDHYTLLLDSPLGPLTLRSDGECVTALRFGIHQETSPLPCPVLARAARELAEYFAGERRHFTVPLAPGGTLFQRQVWDALAAIPYGETRTYALILATGHRKRDNITQSMGQLEGVWEEYGAFRGKYEN